MTLSNRTSRAAAGCLALALALPFGMAGCAQGTDAADQGAGTAAETPADQGTGQEEASGEAAEASQQVATITYYDNDSDESITSTYTYDDAGRLISAEDVTMTQKWTYDDAGRLTKEETVYAADEEDEGGEQTTTYTYDDNGTLVERIFEDTTGENLDYETGEPMTDPDTGAVLDDYKRTYTYEDDGKKMTTTVTNADGQWIGGTVSTFAESALQLFPTVSVKPEELGVVVDPWKPIKEETVTEDGTVTESSEYTYNEAGEITTLTSTYEDEEGSEKIIWTSTYDDKGNETMTTVAMEGSEEDTQETPTEWTYNETGQAIEKVSFDPFFGTTYEFYTYDSAGRLKSITYVQPQDGAEHLVGCQIYDYVADNEDPASTPQQLMEEAAAKVPVQESTDEEVDGEFLEGEEIDLSDLEGLDLEGLELEDVEGVEEEA